MIEVGENNSRQRPDGGEVCKFFCCSFLDTISNDVRRFSTRMVE